MIPLAAMMLVCTATVLTMVVTGQATPTWTLGFACIELIAFLAACAISEFYEGEV